MIIETATPAAASEVNFEMQQLTSVLDRLGVAGGHCGGCLGCSGCVHID
jgi:hypothetical protein